MKKTKISVYLAGPFTSPDWRDRVIAEAPMHNYIDPRRNNQTSSATITLGDLVRGVEESDVVFMYRLRRSDDTGANIEVGCGFGSRQDKKKIIVLVDENRFQHPLLTGIAKRHFTDLEAGILY